MEAEYKFKYIYEDNTEMFVEAVKRDYFVEKELRVEELVNGIVVPAPIRNKADYPEGFASRRGGVTDKQGNYIDISERRLLRYKMDHVIKEDLYKVQYKDETVCYLGPIAGYWGHILTEISCCLWYALEYPNMKWVYFDYTDPKVTLIRRPLLEFLELVGIKESDLIPITEPTQFSKVIVPEVSAVFGEWYTKEYKNIYDFIRGRVEGNCTSHHKIYLTKTEFDDEKNNQIGEGAIKKVFASNGWFCVAPEKISIKEQVVMMANAEEIVAPEGTLPHNILFCQDHVKVTIINRKADVNKYQMLINQLRNAKVTYVDCWHMLLPVYHGPYIFSINQNFINYANDNNILIKINDRQYIHEYLKIFWYILRYLQLYDMEDERKVNSLKKVWNYDSLRGFITTRKEMESLNLEEADKFNTAMQEFIRQIVD